MLHEDHNCDIAAVTGTLIRLTGLILQASVLHYETAVNSKNSLLNDDLTSDLFVRGTELRLHISWKDRPSLHQLLSNPKRSPYRIAIAQYFTTFDCDCRCSWDTVHGNLYNQALGTEIALSKRSFLYWKDVSSVKTVSFITIPDTKAMRTASNRHENMVIRIAYMIATAHYFTSNLLWLLMFMGHWPHCSRGSGS